MSKRTDQVESVVQHAVATSLQEHLATGAVVTVTGVEVSPDLKHGTVWISVLGGDEKEVLEQVGSVRRDVQADVNAQMKSKFTPRLEFRIDRGGEYADRINQVLKNL